MPQRYSSQTSCGTKLLLFHAIVYGRMKTTDFHLDPEGFYAKTGGSIPEIPHFEIEIVEPQPAELARYDLPVMASRFDPTRYFIRRPSHTPTRPDAELVFAVWAVACTAKICLQIDLDELFRICPNDTKVFFDYMRRKFEVTLERGPTQIR